VVAEQELLSAAAAIDAAAKKLAVLERRAPQAAAVDESLPFEEQILHATRAIASASSALVKAASAAQRELFDSSGAAGAAGSPVDMYSEEAALSANLVLAAKTVAHATESLCEAANATVQGGAADEKLVASAKAVAKSTAQLMMACRVKGTAASATMKRLQAAGTAVRKAADNLVRAAQSNAGEEEDEVALDARRVQAMRQEIEAVEVIVKQERELETAKRALAKIRANKYGKSSAAVEWASSLQLK
jgi:talin